MVVEKSKENFTNILSSLTLTETFSELVDSEVKGAIQLLAAETHGKVEPSEEDIASLRKILKFIDNQESKRLLDHMNTHFPEKDTTKTTIKDFIGDDKSPDNILKASIEYGLSENEIYQKLNEADGDEEEEGSESAAGESRLASGGGEEDVEEDGGGDEEEDEKKVEQQEQLLNSLNKVNKNIEKIDGLESKEDLKDIYLQEFGKKFLIERKLQELGYEFNNVEEDVVDELFEQTKFDGKLEINLNKSKRKFFSRIGLNESNKVMKDALRYKSYRSLNENQEVLIKTNGVNVSICNSGVEGELLVSCESSDSSIVDTLMSGFTKYEDMYVVENSELGILLTRLDSGIVNDNYAVIVDNMYVGGEEGENDLVDDQDNAYSYEDYSDAEEKVQELYENFGWNSRVVTVSNNGTIEHKKNTGKYFKLFENFTSNNRVIAERGTVVQVENGKYSFKSTDGGNAHLNHDKLFESKLIPISESEYQISLSEMFINGMDKFKNISSLYESAGYNLSYKKWGDGLIKKKAFVALKESTEEEFIITNPEIEYLTTEELEHGYEETYSVEEGMDELDNSGEAGETTLMNILKDGVEEINYRDYSLPKGQTDANIEGIEDEFDNPESPEDNVEYKVNKDLYLNDDNVIRENITENSEKILEMNEVVMYVGGKGFTKDHKNFHDLPLKYLYEFKPFKVDDLIKGERYLVTDLRESKRLKFVGDYYIDSVRLFEFKDSSENEIYLQQHQVESSVMLK